MQCRSSEKTRQVVGGMIMVEQRSSERDALQAVTAVGPAIASSVKSPPDRARVVFIQSRSWCPLQEGSSTPSACFDASEVAAAGSGRTSAWRVEESRGWRTDQLVRPCASLSRFLPHSVVHRRCTVNHHTYDDESRILVRTESQLGSPCWSAG